MSHVHSSGSMLCCLDATGQLISQLAAACVRWTSTMSRLQSPSPDISQASNDENCFESNLLFSRVSVFQAGCGVGLQDRIGFPG